MWKNLSREELDRAYNNSLAVPNSSKLTQHWTNTSFEIRGHLAGELSIPYGEVTR